jgi:hypothetical protein
VAVLAPRQRSVSTPAASVARSQRPLDLVHEPGFAPRSEARDLTQQA